MGTSNRELNKEARRELHGAPLYFLLQRSVGLYLKAGGGVRALTTQSLVRESYGELAMVGGLSYITEVYKYEKTRPVLNADSFIGRSVSAGSVHILA